MNAKFYNKGYINVLTSKLNEVLSIHVDMITASDFWANAIQYAKMTKSAHEPGWEYCMDFFTVCCKDGNLCISTSDNFSKKQLFVLELIKEKTYRQLEKDAILKFVNSL